MASIEKYFFLKLFIQTIENGRGWGWIGKSVIKVKRRSNTGLKLFTIFYFIQNENNFFVCEVFFRF